MKQIDLRWHIDTEDKGFLSQCGLCDVLDEQNHQVLLNVYLKTAMHIVELHNQCLGISPKGVPLLRSALIKLLPFSKEALHRFRAINNPVALIMTNSIADAEEALAAAKEEEGK